MLSKFFRSLLAVSALAIAYVFAFTLIVVGQATLMLHGALVSAGFVAPLALGVNTLGTLQGDVILRRALELVFTAVPELSIFAMGFKELDGSVERALLGQNVRSRTLSLATIGNFGDAPNPLVASDVSGQLRNNRQLMHMFAPAEYNATDRNLIEESARVLAASLGRGLVRNIAGGVSNANFNTTTNSIAPYIAVASGWSRANTLLVLRQAIQDRGMPIDALPPYFIHDSSVEAALLQDLTVVAEFNNKYNEGAIQSGKLPTISGMRNANFPLLSSVNTDGNLVGFGGTPDALMYVARAPKGPGDVIPGIPIPGIYNYITDPKTGFSVRVTQWVDMTTMNVYSRLDWLDGIEVGNPNNLVRLVTGAIAGTAGTVVGLTIVNPGYASLASTGLYGAPTLALTGGGGSSATATCTVTNSGSSPVTTGGGAVNATTITAAGTGYTTAPTVAVTKPSSGSLAGTPSITASVGGLF